MMKSFKEFDIKQSYISFGDENIASSLIKPLLASATSYKRSVGFFSSSVFQTIMAGISAFAKNGGTIKLITSPRLSEDDIQAIACGYQLREEVILNAASQDLIDSVQDFSDRDLNLLAELIKDGILDVKLVTTNTTGMYHDKLGILKDADDNKVVFYGSANSSYSGYRNNYEKVRVVKSWGENESSLIDGEEKEFDDIWEGKNPYLEVHSFSSAAEKKILSVIEYRKEHGRNTPVKLRDYQEEAIQAWVNNGKRGFFVMATGTGKTWTALFSAKKVFEEENALLVICAPYKHLIKQWKADVEGLFPDAKVVLVSSENPKWDKELNDEIVKSKYDPSRQLIVISTILSFQSERFKRIVSKSSYKKMLILDEAHRYSSRDEDVRKEYHYMLGLSATPYSGKDPAPGNELMDFFGGKVFDLPIEKALGKYLVNYRYHPIYVSSTSEEEQNFRKVSAMIAGCFNSSGILINKDAFQRHYRNRLRIISMAEEKQLRISEIIRNVSEKDHIVVYCGDGKVFDDYDGEVRHIEYVRNALDEAGYRTSQFTAEEPMDTRMELIDAFNKADIQAMVAIRCLDEGINIPSIKSALILSSNDNYREFVQRRGRILRQFAGKEIADIYDVVVLPSLETTGLAKIELRRFYEYARLAVNQEELMDELHRLLGDYNIEIDEIIFGDDMSEEVAENE